jgi:hypothetical protein
MPAPPRPSCPVCGRPVSPPGDAAPFPFCSPTCKLVDLGHWLDGNYRIPDPDVAGASYPGDDE